MKLSQQAAPAAATGPNAVENEDDCDVAENDIDVDEATGQRMTLEELLGELGPKPVEAEHHRV